MKKFEYRLQKVLEIKEIVLKKAQRDLAFSQQERQQAETHLKESQYFLEKYAKDIYQERGYTASEMKLKLDYYYQLVDDIQQQKQNIIQIEDKIEEIRRHLLEKQREHKILIKLKSNSYESYLNQLEKEEQTFMDEIASNNNRRLVTQQG